MKHVIFGPLPKPIETIPAKVCTQSNLYFMVREGLVYFLHRDAVNDTVHRFTWASAQGMCLGAPFNTFGQALEYTQHVGGKVYQFDNWSEVLPELLK